MDQTEERYPYHKTFNIEGGDFIHAGSISSQVKRILKEEGFPNDLIRRMSIATFEAEMNVICYARWGILTLLVSSDFLKIVVDDEGVGIKDVNQAMREGFSTADERIRELGFGAGMGLSNIKKVTDEMVLTSVVNQGTHLEFMVNVNPVRNPSRCDSKPGEALNPAGINLKCNPAKGGTAEQQGIISNGVKDGAGR
jgi:anti-sigma regulatory factor (Ser/Thr protein kinase)